MDKLAYMPIAFLVIVLLGIILNRNHLGMKRWSDKSTV